MSHVLLLLWFSTMSMYKIHMRNQGTYVSPTTSSINNKLQVPSTSWRTKKHQSMVPYVIKEVDACILLVICAQVSI